MHRVVMQEYLNIVLKKNKQSGYNGNIMAGIDRRGGINAGGNFSVRQNKFNFTAALYDEPNAQQDQSEQPTV